MDYHTIFSNCLTELLHMKKWGNFYMDFDKEFTLKLLENRYMEENELLRNVSCGSLKEAEAALSSSALSDIEPRLSDSLRNFQNYCIIFNTLLRKAAEQGGVHPLHLDRLSSEFAGKIELLKTPSAGKGLMQEMVRKYCLLVKNHSLKGYSPLVREVIARTESDPTADLSLKAHAQRLNVNPSYLSALFKKETGQTLTQFVNQSRIRYGLFLLNSSHMQIQTVAQHCGIPDLNYFTRLFKKQVGMTPSEYRNRIRS